MENGKALRLKNQKISSSELPTRSGRYSSNRRGPRRRHTVGKEENDSQRRKEKEGKQFERSPFGGSFLSELALWLPPY